MGVCNARKDPLLWPIAGDLETVWTYDSRLMDLSFHHDAPNHQAAWQHRDL
jgi:hypothetical protein